MMESLAPILVALAVAAIAWAIFAAIKGIGAGNKEKLQARLGGDGRDSGAFSGGRSANLADGKSITFQMEVGVSATGRPWLSSPRSSVHSRRAGRSGSSFSA